MSPSRIHCGRYLCGAIRYEILGPALQTTLCHCEDCRRASGAPFVVWTFFKTGTLTWRSGTPKTVRFADRERSFCGDCGTALKFFDPAIPHLFEINTSSLDHPEDYPPGDQCWVADALPWLAHLSGLPRFELTSPIPET